MSTSLLELSGPIMVGPSSSHTAGAMKIGQFARAFFGEMPEKVGVNLHGSFGTVYRGHATDKAIIAGLLNFPTNSPKIKNAFAEAKKAGMNFTFCPCSLGAGMHPNTATITMKKGRKKFAITGASIGGGSIVINKINDFDVNLTESMGLTWTVVVMHKDARGVLLTLTSALTTAGNNIAAVHSVRESRDGDAITIIETDERITQPQLDKIKLKHDAIHSIFAINR